MFTDTYWDWAIEKWDFHNVDRFFSTPLKKQWFGEWVWAAFKLNLHPEVQWSDPNDWEISPTRARDDCEQTWGIQNCQQSCERWFLLSSCSMRVGEWCSFFCHSFCLVLLIPGCFLACTKKEPLIGHYLYRLAEGGWKHGKRKAEAAEPAEKR